MANFLITGARAPVALEIARNLAKHNNRVVMSDSLRFPLSKNTSSIAKYCSIAKPRNNIEIFKQSLLAVIKNEEIDYLIPTCEEAFYIAFIKPELDQYCQVVCPSFDLIAQLHSKAKVLDLCANFDIGLPETNVVSFEELASIFEFDEKIVKREFCRFGNDVLLNPTPDEIRKIRLEQRGHRFLIQEKVHGTELCAYAISYEGRVSAISIYHPLYKLKKAAGFYFSPMRNRQISNFIQNFCESYKVSGQISFDFIVNEDGAHLLECNPRATSGLHLMQNEDLSLCFSGDTQYNSEDGSSEAKMIGLAMLLVGLPKALLGSRLKQWWGDFKSAKDVISINDDKRFLLYSIVSLAELVFIAHKEKISYREASTIDIEWDGETIR